MTASFYIKNVKYNIHIMQYKKLLIISFEIKNDKNDNTIHELNVKEDNEFMKALLRFFAFCLLSFPFVKPIKNLTVNYKIYSETENFVIILTIRYYDKNLIKCQFIIIIGKKMSVRAHTHTHMHRIRNNMNYIKKILTSHKGVMFVWSFIFFRYPEKSVTKSISSISSPRRRPSTSSLDLLNSLQLN